MRILAIERLPFGIEGDVFGMKQFGSSARFRVNKKSASPDSYFDRDVNATMNDNMTLFFHISKQGGVCFGFCFGDGCHAGYEFAWLIVCFYNPFFIL